MQPSLTSARVVAPSAASHRADTFFPPQVWCVCHLAVSTGDVKQQSSVASEQHFDKMIAHAAARDLMRQILQSLLT